MGFYQLYGKLGSASPEESSPSQHKLRKAKLPQRSIPNETVSQLKILFDELLLSKQKFMDCVVSLTFQRVTAQRLCYRLDSDLYTFYNNPESQEAIRNLRIQTQTWIQDIQHKLLALDRYLLQEVPTLPDCGPRSAYQMARSRYLQELRIIIVEFLAILDQQKQDLKALCNEYCEFVSEQYYAINPLTTAEETKLFLADVGHPLVLPDDTTGESIKENPHSKMIVAEMLYRRQDMHLILDTLRLIDSVARPLKVVEHRFILNTFSRGFGEPHTEEEADSEDSDSSENSDDALLHTESGGAPISTKIVQTVARLFGSRSRIDNDNIDEDYELRDRRRWSKELDSEEEDMSGVGLLDGRNISSQANGSSQSRRLRTVISQTDKAFYFQKLVEIAISLLITALGIGLVIALVRFWLDF